MLLGLWCRQHCRRYKTVLPEVSPSRVDQTKCSNRSAVSPQRLPTQQHVNNSCRARSPARLAHRARRKPACADSIRRACHCDALSTHLREAAVQVKGRPQSAGVHWCSHPDTLRHTQEVGANFMTLLGCSWTTSGVAARGEGTVARRVRV